MSLLLAASLMTCTAGCSSTPPEVLVVRKCPPAKQYTQAEVDRAATELAALPPGSATPGFIRDYRVMRDQCRAYEGGVRGVTK